MAAESEQKTMSILMILASPVDHTTSSSSSYLELARKLSHNNFFIYLCSPTPTNYQQIKQPLISDHHDHIIIHDDHDHDHDHNTLGLSNSIRLLHLPHDNDIMQAERTFSAILQTLIRPKPNLVIYDSFLPWAPAAARHHGVEAVPFLTSAAATISSPEFAVMNKLEEEGAFLESIKLVMSPRLVLVNTSNQIEGKYVQHLADLLGKEVIPTGHLVPQPHSCCKDDESTIGTGWLSDKPPSSVLYVSFGSQHFLAKQEIEEIATALERSGVSFIWAVRFSDGQEMTIHEALPDGFLRRTGERGLVVEGLVSDAKILASSAVAGFVTVCDWSSALRGLAFGVPVIAMAMEVEQELNARLMAEIGAGMVVGREGPMTYKADEIAGVMMKMMFEEEGDDLRVKVKELSKKMVEKGDEEIDLVVDKLLQLHVKYLK